MRRGKAFQTPDKLPRTRRMSLRKEAFHIVWQGCAGYRVSRCPRQAAFREKGSPPGSPRGRCPAQAAWCTARTFRPAAQRQRFRAARQAPGANGAEAQASRCPCRPCRCAEQRAACARAISPVQTQTGAQCRSAQSPERGTGAARAWASKCQSSKNSSKRRCVSSSLRTSAGCSGSRSVKIPAGVVRLRQPK